MTQPFPAPPLTIAVLVAGGGVGWQGLYALRQRAYKMRALVRRQEQVASLKWMGATSVLGDLTGEWEIVTTGVDAVVWAAGAGASGRF